MEKKFVKINYTNKKIFIQDEFISVFKSVLALPVFNVRNRIENANTILDITLKVETEQYQNVKIKTLPLNLEIDFNVFLFVVKTANEANKKIFTFNIDDLINFILPKVYDDKGNIVKTKTNNRSYYVEQAFQSLEKLRMLTVSFKNKNGRYICGLLSSVAFDDPSNPMTATIEMSANYKEFWLADSNNIYNVDLSIYNRLKKDYSRALYQLYLCNNANEFNTFSLALIREKVRASDTLEDKKLCQSIRAANDELIEIGIIKEAIEVKNLRKTEGFKIKFTRQNSKSTDIKERTPESLERGNVLPKVPVNKDEKVNDNKTENKYNQDFKDVFGFDLSDFDD